MEDWYKISYDDVVALAGSFPTLPIQLFRFSRLLTIFFVVDRQLHYWGEAQGFRYHSVTSCIPKPRLERMALRFGSSSQRILGQQEKSQTLLGMGNERTRIAKFRRMVHSNIR
jgi:hypothetical protein